MGDSFFIIVEGKAFATKILEPGKPAEKVKQYKKGEYFGELALIRGDPRAASVIANVNVHKLVYSTKFSFFG